MIRRLLPALGLTLALFPLCAGAETASLVYDVNSASPDDVRGGFRGGLYPLGDKALFMASEPGSGAELWVTDGTALGTRLVADLCLGPCSSEILFMGTVGGVALFVASQGTDEGDIESTVWRSDGTPRGTYPLGARAVSPGNLCHGYYNAVFQGALYFIFMSDTHGCELWRSDGTAAGTGRLTDLNPGPAHSVPHQLFVLNGRLYFIASDAGGPGLWRLDGTGAVLVERLPGGNFTENFASAGSRVFFTVALDNGASELWISDGTAGGTERLAGVAYRLQVLDGILYFLSTDLDRDSELWRSDGTAQGTRPVTAFQNPEPFASFDFKVEKLGNLLIFAASGDGLPARLWTSGGNPASTRPLAGCPGGCPETPEGASFQKSGSRLLFAGTDSIHGAELWSTDGTGPGTRLLGDLCNGSCSSNPAGFMAYRGAVYFLADNPEGYALWKTDGSGVSRIATLAGERFVFDPFYPAAVIGGKLLLPVTDIAMDTVQLWVSDGEPAGTAMITLIGERGVGSNPFPILALGDRALFIACDGQELGLWTSGGTAATTNKVAGPSVAPCPSSSLPLRLQVAGNLGYVQEYVRGTNSYRLWRTDGTDAGTFVLPVEERFVELPVPFAGKAFFTAISDLGVPSLWETDGTAAGTRKLFDLPGGFGSVLTPLGPDLFLSIGNSLWVTDGTQAGMRQLMSTSNSIAPYNLVRVGNLVYFLANAAGGLWRTDGTPAGTYPVLFGNGPAYDPADLVAFNGALYFMGRSNPGDARRSLWKTDGTLGGTVRIAEVGRPRDPFYGFTQPAQMTVVGQQLFFVADDGVHGEEVWRTDGTSSGTVLTRDIMPGSATSYPLGLYGAKGRLYFNAGDPDHGYELWVSDGTEAGTRMVQDISPGVQPSDPFWLAQVGDRLFFSADDGVTGREPWVLPLAGPAGCVPSDRVLCLGGGRFRAEIQWRDFEGHSDRGHAVSLTPDTGYFWFFDAANVEVIVKALDGQGLNGHHWVFYGALSSVEYTLTVTDTQTGAARRYINPSGRLGSVGDTVAFGPQGATGSSLSLGPAAEEWKPAAVRSRTAAVLAPCVPSSNRLCLNQGRFAVEAVWRDFQGNAGTAAAVPLTGDTGYFWFFDEKNVEVVLKVLDGQALNGKFWVFYGALSSVEYTLTVTDTQTGQTRTYKNPSGRLASVADTGAF